MRSYPVLHFWRCLSCLVSWCLVKNQKYGYLSYTVLWVELSKPPSEFYFSFSFLVFFFFSFPFPPLSPP